MKIIQKMPILFSEGSEWRGIADAGVGNKMLDAIMAGSDNPHWYQLKGDVLFNMGKIEESEEWG